MIVKQTTIQEVKRFKIYFKAEFDCGQTGGWGFDAPEEVLYDDVFESYAQVEECFNEIMAQATAAGRVPMRTLCKKIYWRVSSKNIELISENA